ncbi:type II CAAX prenyl endopeptidase Rce1 family protein [Natrialbaceae archaeon GCM10025810]|uniref:CPBP family intramembrane glutamic endopeptidase n=1 Tax=Halovalidus salilacus TaxID=3075124 RepID=UPI00361FFE5F
MPAWGTFAGLSVVVLLSLLVLSHLTQTAFSESDVDTDDSTPESASESSTTAPDDSPNRSDTSRTDDSAEGDSPDDSAEGDSPDDSAEGDSPDDDPFRSDGRDRNGVRGPTSNRPADGTATARAEDPDRSGTDSRPRSESNPRDLSTGALLANVALSQGLFAGVLLGAAVYAEIPPSAFGLEFSREYVLSGLALGAALGLVLYVANEVAAAGATRVGFDHEEELRELLAPDSAGAWLVLLCCVLPIIAVFEELLFRAALIGVLSAGFDLSPWLLAVVSSVAFAFGHGVQGSVGVVVTGALGFVLAAAFVLTGSFLVVVVAHYLINALEFVVHEGIGLDWAGPLEGHS